MPTTREFLESEALKLPPGDRSRLLERLLDSQDPDPDVEGAWAREADRREAELDCGAVQAVRLRARLG